MSIHNYHSTLRNIPEERRSHVRRGGSLKSCNVQTAHFITDVMKVALAAGVSDGCCFSV
jgi:hypothetical protein